MIKGMHGLVYSDDAEATRAFLRDNLGFDATDVGGGWLIFDFPEADLGVHPTSPADEETPAPGHHSISFYCDDLAQTLDELESNGVSRSDEIHEEAWGRVAQIEVPGIGEVMVYEPKYDR